MLTHAKLTWLVIRSCISLKLHKPMFNFFVFASTLVSALTLAASITESYLHYAKLLIGAQGEDTIAINLPIAILGYIRAEDNKVPIHIVVVGKCRNDPQEVPLLHLPRMLYEAIPNMQFRVHLGSDEFMAIKGGPLNSNTAVLLCTGDIRSLKEAVVIVALKSLLQELEQAFILPAMVAGFAFTPAAFIASHRTRRALNNYILASLEYIGAPIHYVVLILCIAIITSGILVGASLALVVTDAIVRMAQLMGMVVPQPNPFALLNSLVILSPSILASITACIRR